MAHKEMKYDLETLIKKVQLGHAISKEEEVFYLMEALEMSKKMQNELFTWENIRRLVF